MCVYKTETRVGKSIYWHTSQGTNGYRWSCEANNSPEWNFVGICIQVCSI